MSNKAEAESFLDKQVSLWTYYLEEPQGRIAARDFGYTDEFCRKMLADAKRDNRT